MILASSFQAVVHPIEVKPNISTGMAETLTVHFVWLEVQLICRPATKLWKSMNCIRKRNKSGYEILIGESLQPCTLLLSIKPTSPK